MVENSLFRSTSDFDTFTHDLSDVKNNLSTNVPTGAIMIFISYYPNNITLITNASGMTLLGRFTETRSGSGNVAICEVYKATADSQTFTAEILIAMAHVI